MGRQPCCEKVGLKKGPWTAEEDKKLINFILTNGQCCWRALPKLAGLLRCGKSCRLRWTNYLRPDLKRGLLSEHEETLVIDLHSQLGNRWSKIASHLSGRTDNEIKNHWNTHIKKKLRKMGIDPTTHKPLPPPTTNQIQEHSTEEAHQDTEIETSNEPTIAKDTQPKQMVGIPSEPSLVEVINDGFCIDEVPLLEPHEILVPSFSSSSSSSSSSSNSSNSTSSSYTSNFSINNMLEDLKFLPTFDWNIYGDDCTNNIIGSLWNDDDFRNLDLLIDDFDDSDRNYENNIAQHLDITRYSRMVLDEESWKYELL